MPENTDHPTQKPEKLLAKLLLASSRENDFVFDPFLGSGTTVAVARKLGRHFVTTECDANYVRITNEKLAAMKEHADMFGEFVVPVESSGRA